jgi:sulfite reductase alpha subunit-like flavoprotein
VLDRLSLAHLRTHTISISISTSKPSPSVAHILANTSSFSVSHIFTHVLDLSTPPKRPFLRMLAEYTKDEKERSQLLELARKDQKLGTKAYDDWANDKRMSLGDLFDNFTSCCPPADHVSDKIAKIFQDAFS